MADPALISAGVATLAVAAAGLGWAWQNERRKVRDLEAALGGSRARLRAIFDDSPLSMVLLDPLDPERPMKIVDCNEAACRLHGYTRGELVGQGLELLDPTQAITHELARKRLARLKQEGSYRGEARHCRKDGAFFSIEFNVSLVTIAGHDYVLGIDRDLTTRRAMEEAVRGSEERFRLITEMSPDAIVVLDPGDTATPMRIMECNERVCDLHGYEKHELVGQSLDILEAVPWTRARIEELLQRLRRERHVRGEKQHRRRDGSTLLIEYATSLVVINGREYVLGLDRDITARKATEAALRTSEERVRLIIDANPDSIQLLDLHDTAVPFRMVECNDASCRLHGYVRADLIGRSIDFLEAKPWATTAEAEIVREKFRREGTLRGTGVHRRKDGSTFPIEFSSRLIVVGGREYVIAIDRDIGAQVRAREELVASQARYRSLFEGAPIPFWEEDMSAVKNTMDAWSREAPIGDWRAFFRAHPDKLAECLAQVRIIDINRACLEHHEAPDRETFLAQVPAYLGKDLQTVLVDEFARFHAGETQVEYETTILTLRGKERHALQVVKIIPGFEQTWERVLVSTIDLTARKVAEAEARRGAELNRLVLNATNDGIWDWDVVGARITFSERCRAMLGYTYDELPDSPLEKWDALIHPDDIEAKREALRAHWERGEPYAHQSRFKHKDGGWRWLISRGLTLFDDAGKPKRMVGSYTDVTELKRIDAELLQSRKLRAVGEMVGGISHEVNNLLTPMLLHAELLAVKRPDDEVVLQHLRPIRTAIDRARELTQRILAFGRRSADAREIVGLYDVAKENLEFVAQTIDRRIRLDLEPPTLKCWVKSSRSDLNQILVNLLFNARDTLVQKAAQPPSDWTPRIEVSVHTVTRVSGARDAAARKTVRRWHCLTVRDNGLGMDDGVRERVFEPFFTTKEVGRGTGLGLATIWHLSTGLGGWVDVESEPGHGSAFHVFLPAHDTAGGSAPPLPGAGGSRPPMLAPAVPDKTRPRVLLAEDNEFVAHVTADLVKVMGGDVTHAADGLAAWKLLEPSLAAFDVVLTDLNMPGLSGVELVQRLRASSFAGRIVVYSGHFSRESETALRDAGIKFILRKPFETEALRTAVFS